MARGKVIWLTGMSGAGKTTIASSASLILGEMGISVHQIDGDDVRKSYGRKLGFSRADIFRNNQTVVQLADAARKISDLVNFANGVNMTLNKMSRNSITKLN